MNRIGRLLTALLMGALGATAAEPAAPTKVDSRLGKLKTLNDYFPWTPPSSLQQWQVRRQELRKQVLVATGLWPMPEKFPIRPVIHGKIDRDDYTIEKVFFASYPGHYVSGNLYRPKGRRDKLPGVLCPHGHWPNGRFFDAASAYGEQRVQHEITSGAEKTIEGARYPLQARCAQLARMGCVVFHYDMVGNADSRQIEHSRGFTDAEAELRLQSFMGLQTYNSIRALDFLTTLPDVDASRIGVTGASGGGTQTFVLCAIDERPTVAFPAVMVSTGMQGGCICENCSYLRQNTGNIELAALFAPKPLGMTGADDWTKEIETKGFPQLQELYRLYGSEDRVMAKAFLQFGHNYNQVSREVMYNWFNKHLKLGCPEPVVEKPFVPVPPKDLAVYDEQHPRPSDASDARGLRRYMTELSDKQMGTLPPRDAATLDSFREVVGTALSVMISDHVPHANELEVTQAGEKRDEQGFVWQQAWLGRRGQSERIPSVVVRGRHFDGNLVVWVHPAGKSSLHSQGKLVAPARQILDKGGGILAPDVFMTGELTPAKPPQVDPRYAGYTFGYNRSVLANRVHDVLTAVAYGKHLSNVKSVHLLGLDEAGPWTVLARALSRDVGARTAADMHQFRFDQVLTTNDAMMLPGALKYGGMPGLSVSCAPGELFVHNVSGEERTAGWLRDAYRAAGASERLVESNFKVPPEDVVAWLLR
jgi:dienelactone hydrolase